MSLPLMKNYVNGEWVESNTTTFGDVWNPGLGEKIATVPYGTREDVDRAVQAAKEAFWEWRSTPPLSRARYLFRLNQEWAAMKEQERRQQKADSDARWKATAPHGNQYGRSSSASGGQSANASGAGWSMSNPCR